MKNYIVFIFVAAFIAFTSTAHALPIEVEFTDTAKDWDGFSTPYGDVIGSPDLTGGRFIFEDHVLKGIELDYASTDYGYMPGDWFFDVDQDNKWDFVIHNSKHAIRHGYSSYKLYEVDLPIYDWDYYVTAYTRGWDTVREGHPVQASGWDLFWEDRNPDYVTFNQWIHDRDLVDEDNPATAIWGDFSIDLSDYAGKEITYAFAMTCGNDVIFGKTAIPSPEPGTIVLLGLGLIGLFYYDRKRRAANKLM